MPIFEVLGGTRSVNNTLDYCEKETVEVKDEETGVTREVPKCVLKAGVNCDIADIRFDFAETRNHFNKRGGRQGMHFCLSFDPKELPNTIDNQQKCLEVGMDLAEKIAPGHESGVFVHIDRGHLHCHIVSNAVAFLTGEKYHMEKNKDLVILRNLSDRVCQEHGVEPLAPYQGQELAKKSVEKRIEKRGGVTWKGEIVEAVKYAKSQALSEEHFRELLAEKGVERYQRGEKSFGYEHVAQRESGNPKFRMRDSNKALEGNHYADVLAQIRQNQNPQAEKDAPGKEPERRDVTPSSAPSVSLPPVEDEFEETIAQNQAKKADIRANTAHELEEAEDERERAEIKEKEAYALEQAERDKEIRLQEAEFYEFFRKMQAKLPLTTYPEVEEGGLETSFYYGGATRKQFRVTLEREDACVSLARQEEGAYREQDMAFLGDRMGMERLQDRIAKQAVQQEQQARLYRGRTGLER